MTTCKKTNHNSILIYKTIIYASSKKSNTLYFEKPGEQIQKIRYFDYNEIKPEIEATKERFKNRFHPEGAELKASISEFQKIIEPFNPKKIQERIEESLKELLKSNSKASKAKLKKILTVPPILAPKTIFPNTTFATTTTLTLANIYGLPSKYSTTGYIIDNCDESIITKSSNDYAPRRFAFKNTFTNFYFQFGHSTDIIMTEDFENQKNKTLLVYSSFPESFSNLSRREDKFLPKNLDNRKLSRKIYEFPNRVEPLELEYDFVLSQKAKHQNPRLSRTNINIGLANDLLTKIGQEIQKIVQDLTK